MRTNFNFKAEWAVAIQMLSADIRLSVYETILSMGLHDISLADALDANGTVINDEDAMNLLINVEKVLTRRRRARERAAARRRATAENNRISGNASGSSNDNAQPTPVIDTKAPIAHSDTNPDTDHGANSVMPTHDGPVKKTGHKRRHKRKHKSSRARH